MQMRKPPAGDRVRQALHEFLHLEAAGGLILMLATAAFYVACDQDGGTGSGLERLGILIGSLLSGVLGYVVLRMVLGRRPDAPADPV
jgi:Na+/H+ antiporter NhaA